MHHLTQSIPKGWENFTYCIDAVRITNTVHIEQHELRTACFPTYCFDWYGNKLVRQITMHKYMLKNVNTSTAQFFVWPQGQTVYKRLGASFNDFMAYD